MKESCHAYELVMSHMDRRKRISEQLLLCNYCESQHLLHIWKSRVTHMNLSCHIWIGGSEYQNSFSRAATSDSQHTANMWMRHNRYMSDSHHTVHYERVMSHMKRTSEQFLPCGCQWKLNMSQMWMSHNTCHKCEWVITCHKCEWVITYIWAIHITLFI